VANYLAALCRVSVQGKRLWRKHAGSRSGEVGKLDELIGVGDGLWKQSQRGCRKDRELE